MRPGHPRAGPWSGCVAAGKTSANSSAYPQIEPFSILVSLKALWMGSNLATILTMCLRLELGWV